MNFRIAPAARKTGNMLHRLVRERLEGSVDAIVCYGSGYSGSLPALNARCTSYDKRQQAIILRRELGALAINPLSYTQARGEAFPLLGRMRKHAQGKDIRLVLEPWQLDALAETSDFFVPYLSSVSEWRVWVYRKRHLGSYRKALVDPSAMRRVGRNYKNGFRFEKVERQEVPESLKELARRAIAALQLDFGAVDVLETAPGEFVVLEVNTAPGVADERRTVVQKLAQRIALWAEKGFPNAYA